MRLGQEDEPRQQLEMCYDNGYRDAATVNSLRLLDSYKNFVTFKDDTTILKLHKKEADLLRPYFEAELKRAIADYEKKYKMKLPGPVQVEVYPDHEDFAVRTMGMPGLGALGVTFGEVVAMDSPSGRPPGEFHWASTLWHEMSHVYILTATNSPRAALVHRRAGGPRGDRSFSRMGRPHDAGHRRRHARQEIAPGRGTRPRLYPSRISGAGDRLLLPGGPHLRLHPGAAGARTSCWTWCIRLPSDKTTPEVIQQDLGMSPEEFDKQFQAWLDKDVGKTVAGFDEWRTSLKDLAQPAKDRNYDEVLKEGEEVRRMYPEYVYAANAYEFMAEADLAKGDKQAAAAILRQYEKIGGHNPGAEATGITRRGTGQPGEAAATLDRINYIYPVG